MTQNNSGANEDVVELFFELRRRKFPIAAVGLWMDHLGMPLLVSGHGTFLFDPDAQFNNEANVVGCRRIVALLSEEMSQALDFQPTSLGTGAPTQTTSDTQVDAASEACDLMHAIALDCALFLQKARQGGADGAAIRRFAGVIRSALEPNPLERACFNPETGEFVDLRQLPDDVDD
jgi:hypothetical protein